MLRDKFAMAAMQGMLAAGMMDQAYIAEQSYNMANAMMNQRDNWDFSDDPEGEQSDPVERIPHGVKVFEIQTPQQEVSAADLWGVAFKHHEATQGKVDLPKPAYEPAGFNTRRALAQAIKEQCGSDVQCKGYSIDGLISILETSGTIGLTEELTPAGHTTKAVLKDAIKRFHGHDNVSITDPLEVLIDRLETGLPF